MLVRNPNCDQTLDDFGGDDGGVLHYSLCLRICNNNKTAKHTRCESSYERFVWCRCPYVIRKTIRRLHDERRRERERERPRKSKGAQVRSEERIELEEKHYHSLRGPFDVSL